MRKNTFIQSISGLKSIKVVFQDILDVRKEIVGWGATDRALQLIPGFTRAYLHERERRGIAARQLYVDGNNTLENVLSKFKKVPSTFPLPATTLIYGDRIAHMLWFSKPIRAVVIRHKELADAYRNYFNFIWKTQVFEERDIVASSVFQEFFRRFFGHSRLQFVHRRYSVLIRKVREEGSLIKRIVLLPPGGQTAHDQTGLDDFQQVSPHPEYEKAFIEVKGGVHPGRNGFTKADSCLRFSYYSRRDAKVGNKRFYREEIKSSHAPKFIVVRENGWGFYHNLKNISNEWLCLVFEGHARSAKEVQIASLLKQLSPRDQKIVKQVFETIRKGGDAIFQDHESLLSSLLRIHSNHLIPLLIEMLNIPNYGNHEACTVFALLLKAAKKDPKNTLLWIQSALTQKSAPEFYLQQLEKKIMNMEHPKSTKSRD